MSAITVNVLKGDTKKALKAGCDACMPKPVNINELDARVEKHLIEESE
jgi:DNA-binding response OmpR family regulator